MKKRRIAQIAVISILLLIPGLYVSIFLSAYYDPISNLSNVPVAVVNQDEGGKISDETTNIGKKIVKNLKANDTVNWVFTNKSKADYGVIHEKYYAELIIPKNFTKKISTVSDRTKEKGIIYFKSNDKLGMMGSSLMSNVSTNVTANITRSISKSIIDNMSDGMSSMPAGMEKLSNVLGKLDKGTEQLKKGLNNMQQGQRKFNGGLNKLSSGVGNAEQGADKLSTALQIISGKSNQFANAINQNAAGTKKLSSYSGKFKNGLSTATGGLDNYINISSAQLEKSINMMMLLKKYITAHPECVADENIKAILASINSSSSNGKVDPSQLSAKLTAALKNLNGAYGKLDAGIQKLPQGMQQAGKGANTLSGAMNKISDGSGALSSGMKKAAAGSNMLNEKSKLILSGDEKVYDGVLKLNSGIKRTKSSVDNSLSKLKDTQDTLHGLGKFASKPIVMKNIKIGKAENIGTEFASFILSLSLFLGGLLTMAILFNNKELKFYETKITKKIHVDFGILRYPLIVVGQSIVAAFCAFNIVGIKVQSTPQAYGICILTALALSIFVEALTVVFKALGQMLCLILMVCQLTAGGGIMPIKVLPPFYRAIHPYLPMSYTITALRNVIQGFETQSYNNSIGVMVGIALVGALIILLCSFLEHRKKGIEETAAQEAAIQ